MNPATEARLYMAVTAGDTVTMFLTGVPSLGIPSVEQVAMLATSVRSYHAY